MESKIKCALNQLLILSPLLKLLLSVFNQVGALLKNRYSYFLSSHIQLSVYLHFIRDAEGHPQRCVGLCVLFKGIAGENFRSNTKILQLPAHSQKTPLCVAGINLTTFTLLVSPYIGPDPGRNSGWVWDRSQMCVYLVEWVGVLLPKRKEYTVSSPTTLWQGYIHHQPNTSVSLPSPSSSSLFPLSLPPSIHYSSHPSSHLLPSLRSAGVFAFPFFSHSPAPGSPTHLLPGLPEYHLHRWCLIITPALLYLSPSSSLVEPFSSPEASFLC